MRYLAILLILWLVPVWAQPEPLTPFEEAMKAGAAADASGQPTQALKAYGQAVALAETALDQPELLIRSLLKLGNLTARAGNEGREQQAETIFARALAVAEKAYGPNDPRLVEPLNALGWQRYYGLHRTALAEADLTRALTITEAAMPADSLQVADARFMLSNYFKAQQEYPRAIAGYRQALATYEKEYGVEHQRTRYTRLCLGQCLLSDKQYDDAQAQLQSLVDVTARVNAGGWSHSEALAWLSLACIAQGQYDRAEPLEIQVFTYAEKLMGKDNMGMMNYLRRMVQFYQEAHQPEKALPYAQRLIALMSKPNIPAPALAKAREQYAELLVALKRPVEAKGEYRATYDLYECWLSKNIEKYHGIGELVLPSFFHKDAAEYQQFLTRYAAFLQGQQEEAEAAKMVARAAEVAELLARSKAIYAAKGK